MKYTNSFGVLLILSTKVLGQLQNFPTCAQSPAISAAQSSGCDLSDYKCLCTNSGFQSAIVSSLSNSCSCSDQAATCQAANGICAQYGVTIPCQTVASCMSTMPASTMMTSTSLSTSMAVAATGGVTPSSSATTAASSSVTTVDAMATSTSASSAMSSMMSSMMSSIASTSTVMYGNGSMMTTTASMTIGNATVATHSPTSTSKSSMGGNYTGAAVGGMKDKFGAFGAVLAAALAFALL